jgi:hypothetical protein
LKEKIAERESDLAVALAMQSDLAVALAMLREQRGLATSHSERAARIGEGFEQALKERDEARRQAEVNAEAARDLARVRELAAALMSYAERDSEECPDEFWPKGGVTPEQRAEFRRLLGLG